MGLEHGPTNASERQTGDYAFLGISTVYILSRFVLAGQYSLVYCCARAKSYTKRNHLLFQIASLCISAGMWIGSLFMEYGKPSTGVRYSKFGLWYGGILIEVMAPFVSMWFGHDVTEFKGTNLTERFSALTLLILGEGVIGFAFTLQGSTYTRFKAALMDSCWRHWVHKR